MARDVIIKINVQDKDLDTTINKLKQLGVVDEKNAKTFENTGKKFKKAQDENVGAMGKLSGAIGNAGKMIAGAFAAQALIGFGKKIIDTTAEFQKMEAVLTNTLGSSSEAQKSLAMIRDFAAKTPFSVKELTESFVKLANQGFKPTADEMRKLGDLASSTGKGFDQLAEAVIDAQTGEFERLKEFGIRAQKEGDKVTFTFKGVKTQTDFTNESIKEYITNLGDLQGVSGSMAAISGTLGGQISNLGDSFDTLLLNLGTSSSEISMGFVKGISNMISSINDLMGEQVKEQDVLEETRVGLMDELDVITKGNLSKEAMKEQIANINEKYGEYLPNLIDEEASLTEISKLQGEINKQMQSKILFLAFEEEFTKIMKDQITTQKGIVKNEVDLEKLRQQRLRETDPAMAQMQEAQLKMLESGAKIGETIESESHNRVETLTSNYKAIAERMGLLWDDVLNNGKEVAKKEVEITKGKTKEQLKAEADAKKELERLQEANLKVMRKAQDDYEKYLEDTEKRRLDIQKQRDELAVSMIEDDTTREITALMAKFDEEISLLDEQKDDEAALILEKKQKLENDITEIIEEGSKKRTKIADDEAQKQLAANLEVLHGVQQGTNDLLGTFSMYYDSRIAQIDKQAANEEITDEEAQARKKKLLREQAELQKATAMFNTIIKIAEAIMVAQTAGPLIGQILAGTTAAVGAIQLGIIASTPIPAFKKGTKGKKGSGLSRVGEEGEELMFVPDGAKILPHKQTAQYSEMIDAMYDNKLDDYILKSYLPKILPNVGDTVKNKNFIDALTNNLGANGFSGDEIVDTLNKMDKNENKRTMMLANAIISGNKQKPNFRRL